VKYEYALEEPTVYDVVTIASMVEHEAVSEGDRRRSRR
jgi:cell division protein YceG involved in septum cleavage